MSDLSACIAVPSQVPDPIRAALLALGRVVAPSETSALYAPLAEREPYENLKVHRNVQYGPDPRHLLDIFEPADASNKRPVLLFLHGGAFVRGDRRIGDSPFNDNIAIWAARNGFVGVNMTYRLAPANPWPAAQLDVRLALEWMGANATRFGANPDQVVLMGHSAGAAHVAQYLACSEFHVAPRGGVVCAVMLSGLFDPSTAEVNPPLQAYFGIDTSLYSGRSAVPGLVACDVPMLIAFAELDPEDFCQQGRQLQLHLANAGKSAQVVQLMGHSHMSEIYSINTRDTMLTALLSAFIEKSTSVGGHAALLVRE